MTKTKREKTVNYEFIPAETIESPLINIHINEKGYAFEPSDFMKKAFGTLFSDNRFYQHKKIKNPNCPPSEGNPEWKEGDPE